MNESQQNHTNDHYFPHEKLRVYHVALEFSAWVASISARIPRGRSNLRNQLVRASDSMVSNVAEGANHTGKTRINHYRIARGSAGEASGQLDVLFVTGEPWARDEQPLLREFSRMMSALVRNQSRRLR